MPTKLSPALAEWLTCRHGVVTTAELRRFGAGRKAQARLVELGVLRPLARGCLVLATASPTLEHRCAVLCRLHPPGFVTSVTAATLARLRRQPKSALLFATRHGLHLDAMPGVQFRQTTKISPADRLVRDDGIVVASWPRLAFDLARDLPRLGHLSVVNQMLDRELVTNDELTAIGRRLCHPARRGSTTFARTLNSLIGVQDSDDEVLLGDALRRRGVPVVAQVPAVTAVGVTYHADLAVESVRWAVELDIHPEHRSAEGHHNDSRRRRLLHAAGWQVETVAELDLLSLEALADELAALYARHRIAATTGTSDIRGSGDPTWRASTLG